jgi:hypothetical protein
MAKKSTRTGNVTPIRAGAEPTAQERFERREAQRDRLFRALGIVGVVKRTLEASECAAADGTLDSEFMMDSWGALEAAYAIMVEIRAEGEQS